MGEIKPWVCRGNRQHMLGQVQDRRLYLYRQAIDLEALELPAVDVIGVVDGYMDVRCSICGASRPWIPGPEAIRRMVREFAKSPG